MSYPAFLSPGRALPLALAASLLLVAGVTGQETERDRDRDGSCVCLGGDIENAFGRAIMRTNRAVIGVVLGRTVELDDGRGVHVDGLSNDGPAQTAGLEAGDVITAIDGEGLGTHPAEALVDALRELEPGATVRITYDRDGERRTVDVVTEARSPVAFWTGDEGVNVRVAPRGPDGLLRHGRLQDPRPGLSVVTPRSFFRRLMPGALEMVELNPELGGYFGTDEGVLVTAVHEDASLGLRPGDVILSIDGRDVRDPAHVRSILASYRADEVISFRIVRQDRRTDVTGTLGD